MKKVKKQDILRVIKSEDSALEKKYISTIENRHPGCRQLLKERKNSAVIDYAIQTSKKNLYLLTNPELLQNRCLNFWLKTRNSKIAYFKLISNYLEAYQNCKDGPDMPQRAGTTQADLFGIMQGSLSYKNRFLKEAEEKEYIQKRVSRNDFKKKVIVPTMLSTTSYLSYITHQLLVSITLDSEAVHNRYKKRAIEVESGIGKDKNRKTLGAGLYALLSPKEQSDMGEVENVFCSLYENHELSEG